MQRRPRSAVHVVLCEAVRGPAERGRSAPAVALVYKEDSDINENGESWNRFIAPLQELEALGELADERRLRRFQLVCCRYIWGVIAEIARHALASAEQFAAGELTEPELVAQRVALWKWLGNRSCDFISAEVNAVRAVICCLYEKPDLSVAYESAINFVEFCEAAMEEPLPHMELLCKVYRCRDSAK